ncbi:MAG: hypothetical protein JXR96_03350 [Deltaproteobacteria bacterium]|nr:hypothetical protein [Deltaproteobacteria bacterium]
MVWAIAGGAVGAILLVVIIVLVRRSGRGDPETIAKRLGLTYQNGKMRGMIHGFTVGVETQRSGAQSRTVFSVQFPDRLGMGLAIAANPSGQRSHRALASGDDAFDAAVCIEAREQAKALELLTPERRQCIRELIASDPSAWIDDTGLRWTTDGALDDFDALKRFIDSLVDAAIDFFPGRTAYKAVRSAERQRARLGGR